MQSIKYIVLLLCLLSTLSSKAQKIQWASSVSSVSSEWGELEYSSQQALGVPNGFRSKDLSYMCWSPSKKEQNSAEHIEVVFAKPQKANKVIIAEGENPGAIEKIWAYGVNNKKHLIHESKSTRNSDKNYNLLIIDLPLTKFDIERIKIELNTKRVPGYNKIDAIGIAQSQGEVKLEINKKRVPNEYSYSAENLGLQINSPFAERMPFITLDGAALYFARKDHPQNIGQANQDDIWVSYFNQDNNSWSNAVNVGPPLNNEKNNFVIAVNSSGTSMFLANDYQGKLKDAISYTKRNGRSWDKPQRLKISNYKNDSKYVSYHVSNDEQYLLIAAQCDDSYGDRDFYVSFNKNGSWTSPKNLGNLINTVNSENSIFLAADNKTIYFSSNGHMGYGGYDLFMSKRLDESWTNWSQPINLGKTINTPSNDLSFSIPASGDYAYFSRGPIENTDLYRIKLPEALRPDPVTFIQAQLVDAETQKIIQGNIYFESIGERKNNNVSSNGKAKLVLQNNQQMSLHAKVKGYLPVSAFHDAKRQSLKEEDGDNAQYYSSPEVQALQKKLDELQKDINKLKSKKKEYRRTNKKSTKQSKTQKKNGEKSAFKNVNQNSDKLDELKSKYSQHYNEDQTYTKREVQQKESDTEDLSKLRSKYENFYAKDKAENVSKIDDTKTEKVASEISDELYSEHYLPLVKKLKKEEELSLTNKDMQRINQEVRDELTAYWEEKIKTELREQYDEKIKKERKEEIKRRLEADIKEELKTELSIAIKKEKESQIQNSIQKELTASPKPNPKTPPATPAPQEKTEYEVVVKELLLVPLKVGAVISMNNTFFESNKSVLKNASYSELDRIAEFLLENKNVKIEIGGHTNGWCSPEFASELSKERAEVVYNFFIKKGIKANRLSHKGYGKTQPIAANSTLAGRKKNQRVELKIIDIIE